MIHHSIAAVTTLHLADPQLEHLGPRAFVDNHLVDMFVPPAYRNVTAILTDPLYVDTLLHKTCQGMTLKPRLQLLGDIPDTPCDSEMKDFEAVLHRHDLAVDGYDRGNHSSGNAFGVVNLLSRAYNAIKGWIFKNPNWLEEEVCEACGGRDNILTPQDTFRGMHRILHRSRPDGSTLETINHRVMKREATDIVVSSNSEEIFNRFWCGSPADTSYWECAVNYDVADLPQNKRKDRAPAMYLQAHKEAQFSLETGETIPVFTINMDSQDHNHLFGVMPGISELQIRLIEAFIDHQLRINSRARFKLGAHYPIRKVLHLFTPPAERRAVKRLLNREEIILFTGAHTHSRHVVDLQKSLGLSRQTPLMEMTVPSLVDYSPLREGKDDRDARALAYERMWVEKDPGGRATLKIQVEYKGLDPEDFGAVPAEVQEELAVYRSQHGYIHAHETMKEIRKTYLKGFLKRQWKRVVEFFTVGLNPWHEKKFLQYWKESSVLQNIVDNLTTVSVVQMFNEAEHMIPLLKSIRHFLAADSVPETLAVEGQIQGVLTALETQYAERKVAFDAAVAQGEQAKTLRQYNDLFVRTGVNLLPRILLDLPKEGRARTFAVLAGIEAARAEHKFHKGKPTKVPNQIPLLSIPV